MGGVGQTIYIGMTNNLCRRVWEHKKQTVKGFTRKYNLDRLLFYVEFNNPDEAIAYEKKIKGWVRRKKDALIEEMNPAKDDLAKDWFKAERNSQSSSE
jgi:putative endonuclease